MVEIAGQEKKIEAFIDLMRPFGIIELVRTGRIAMVRGIDRSQQRRHRRPAEVRRAPQKQTSTRLDRIDRMNRDRSARSSH